MHVGDDVGQGRARKELEAALSVFSAGRCGWGQDGEDEVEGAHEKVAESGTLEGRERKRERETLLLLLVLLVPFFLVFFPLKNSVSLSSSFITEMKGDNDGN